jgi:cephalosporin hydroxylase
MAEKKLFTREEFEIHRLESAKIMADDKNLQHQALDLLIKADQHNWIHQTNWFGEPILNTPEDMFAIQEIIYKTKPKYIIEVGVAWGGSLLFYSTILESIGGGKVIGIDIYIPEDLKERINSHGKISDQITLINGSSLDENTINIIKSILKDCKDVLIILDSYHTHSHVFQELTIYSSFIGKGNYIICGDTVVEYLPEQTHRPRPWGPGNNPKTALDEFLKLNDRFEIDKKITNKLLFTCNPDGYLKCIKD